MPKLTESEKEKLEYAAEAAVQRIDDLCKLMDQVDAYLGRIAGSLETISRTLDRIDAKAR